MNPSKLAATCALAAAFVVTLEVRAQAPGKPADNLDVTMTLLPEHAKGPEDITRRIALPPPANPGDKAGRGTDKDKPDDGKSPPADPGAKGRDTADEARERGREFGQDVSEQSRENRENAGRGHDTGNGNAGRRWQ